MSNKSKRKVTIEKNSKEGGGSISGSESSSRRPSVFERLGPNAVSVNSSSQSGQERHSRSSTAAVTVNDQSSEKCRNWLRTGSCAYGSSCRYRHSSPTYSSPSKQSSKSEKSINEKDLRHRVKSKRKGRNAAFLYADRPSRESPSHSPKRTKSTTPNGGASANNSSSASKKAEHDAKIKSTVVVTRNKSPSSTDDRTSSRQDSHVAPSEFVSSKTHSAAGNLTSDTITPAMVSVSDKERGDNNNHHHHSRDYPSSKKPWDDEEKARTSKPSEKQFPDSGQLEEISLELKRQQLKRELELELQKEEKMRGKDAHPGSSSTKGTSSSSNPSAAGKSGRPHRSSSSSSSRSSSSTNSSDDNSGSNSSSSDTSSSSSSEDSDDSSSSTTSSSSSTSGGRRKKKQSSSNQPPSAGASGRLSANSQSNKVASSRRSKDHSGRRSSPKEPGDVYGRSSDRPRSRASGSAPDSSRHRRRSKSKPRSSSRSKDKSGRTSRSRKHSNSPDNHTRDSSYSTKHWRGDKSGRGDSRDAGGRSRGDFPGGNVPGARGRDREREEPLGYRSKNKGDRRRSASQSKRNKDWNDSVAGKERDEMSGGRRHKKKKNQMGKDKSSRQSPLASGNADSNYGSRKGRDEHRMPMREPSPPLLPPSVRKHNSGRSITPPPPLPPRDLPPGIPLSRNPDMRDHYRGDMRRLPPDELGPPAPYNRSPTKDLPPPEFDARGRPYLPGSYKEGAVRQAPPPLPSAYEKRDPNYQPPQSVYKWVAPKQVRNKSASASASASSDMPSRERDDGRRPGSPDSSRSKRMQDEKGRLVRGSSPSDKGRRGYDKRDEIMMSDRKKGGGKDGREDTSMLKRKLEREPSWERERKRDLPPELERGSRMTMADDMMDPRAREARDREMAYSRGQIPLRELDKERGPPGVEMMRRRGMPPMDDMPPKHYRDPGRLTPPGLGGSPRRREGEKLPPPGYSKGHKGERDDLLPPLPPLPPLRRGERYPGDSPHMREPHDYHMLDHMPAPGYPHHMIRDGRDPRDMRDPRDLRIDPRDLPPRDHRDPRDPREHMIPRPLPPDYSPDRYPPHHPDYRFSERELDRYGRRPKDYDLPPLHRDEHLDPRDHYYHRPRDEYYGGLLPPEEWEFHHGRYPPPHEHLLPPLRGHSPPPMFRGRDPMDRIPIDRYRDHLPEMRPESRGSRDEEARMMDRRRHRSPEWLGPGRREERWPPGPPMSPPHSAAPPSPTAIERPSDPPANPRSKFSPGASTKRGRDHSPGSHGSWERSSRHDSQSSEGHRSSSSSSQKKVKDENKQSTGASGGAPNASSTSSTLSGSRSSRHEKERSSSSKSSSRTRKRSRSKSPSTLQPPSLPGPQSSEPCSKKSKHHLSNPNSPSIPKESAEDKAEDISITGKAKEDKNKNDDDLGTTIKEEQLPMDEVESVTRNAESDTKIGVSKINLVKNDLSGEVLERDDASNEPVTKEASSIKDKIQLKLEPVDDAMDETSRHEAIKERTRDRLDRDRPDLEKEDHSRGSGGLSDWSDVEDIDLVVEPSSEEDKDGKTASTDAETKLETKRQPSSRSHSKERTAKDGETRRKRSVSKDRQSIVSRLGGDDKMDILETIPDNDNKSLGSNEEGSDYDPISDDELDAIMKDVEADSKSGGKKTSFDGLDVDWSILQESSKTVTENAQPAAGSARKRFLLSNLLPTMGISQRWAGPEIMKRVLEQCKKEIEEDEQVKKENGTREEVENFVATNNVAAFQVAAVESKRQRAQVLHQMGPFRRALSARQDLWMRRQLCKNVSILGSANPQGNSNVFSSQIKNSAIDNQPSVFSPPQGSSASHGVDKELYKLSLELFRQPSKGMTSSSPTIVPAVCVP